ncbi:LLM class flavin-dependent oxidoreductase [Candidatus Bathyarchaeota archaeon]|nr:LLM class flavin-dependent oxidoreductase [Candidatus Bathyarchaeota archaeon]MBS7629417.1 LLM class flavin-dependent oxidoreductase [Candidatus Bathyarchaeota archaeon]
MNLSLGLTTSISTGMVKWLTDILDQIGVYGVWVGEDIGKLQDIFTLTGTILLETERVKVGIGVTSPLIRNHTTIARAAATLMEISPRFRLGLGVGGLQDLTLMGLKVEKPAKLMEESINLLRAVWRGGQVSNLRLGLTDYRPKYYVDGEIPIFVGARGPRMLRLAADHADGLILSGPKKYIEDTVRSISGRLAERRSRFTFVLWLPTIMVQSKGDLNLAKKTVAIVAADTPDTVLEQAGIQMEMVEDIRGRLATSGVEAAAEHVSEVLMEHLCISGSADEICERFLEYSRVGVDEVVFGPPYGRNPRESIEKVTEAWRVASEVWNQHKF